MDRKSAKTVPSGTGGAVPVKNEKGEISMQKVNVQRYVAGKRPKYAPASDNEDEDVLEENSDSESDVKTNLSSNLIKTSYSTSVEDRRLKRLMEVEKDLSKSEIDRSARHRRVAEPEIIHEAEENEEIKKELVVPKAVDNLSDEEINEEQIMRRRLELKKKALQRQEELLVLEDEAKKSDDEFETEESEYSEEEYSDSEDEDLPRLKPVFVKKQDRVTIQEKEIEHKKEKEIQKEKELLQMQTKKQTRKMIEEEVMKEKLAEKAKEENIECEFLTDDENNSEEDYEAWKLRELKRIKRDREERERFEKEKQEIQRIRNMTEEERAAYLEANPKVLINQAKKGKYKFLQKYYHRGAFFMDQEDDVFKRNFAEPTLEDHFDKTILPKVMQVKNFGMAGRTKYTHLLDQDTTRKDDPWSNQEKFIAGKGGGTKQVFDKPARKKI